MYNVYWDLYSIMHIAWVKDENMHMYMYNIATTSVIVLIKDALKKCHN